MPNGGSNKYALRKMKKPSRSQPTYEIADAGVASVKKEAGIKKQTAVLPGDSKGNQSTVISNIKTSERSQADVYCKHSSGVTEEVISKQEDKAGFMNVLITLASTGLPAKAGGRASGSL
ncbi:hypothetical protein DPMN_185330 [Dreissena polymorpha]|uniref:Uncharacterized protein n=1 Tax=Dreissena polymorpha TaxID=45954 RepID=A0A9D4DJH3_DREPO|nr:hypothetical protein DPMN_185330 [Dreissena polymorpha]